MPLRKPAWPAHVYQGTRIQKVASSSCEKGLFCQIFRVAGGFFLGFDRPSTGRNSLPVVASSRYGVQTSTFYGSSVGTGGCAEEGSNMSKVLLRTRVGTVAAFASLALFAAGCGSSTPKTTGSGNGTDVGTTVGVPASEAPSSTEAPASEPIPSTVGVADQSGEGAVGDSETPTSAVAPAAEATSDSIAAAGSSPATLEGALEQSLTQLGVKDAKAGAACIVKENPDLTLETLSTASGPTPQFMRGMMKCTPDALVEQGITGIKSTKADDTQKRCFLTVTFSIIGDSDVATVEKVMAVGSSKDFPEDIKKKIVTQSVEKCKISADVATEMMNEA